MRRALILVASLSLVGCASQRWVRVDASAAPLSAAKAHCRPRSTGGYANIEPEEAVMAMGGCMERQGWARPEALGPDKG